jgi:hypothetical protein
MKVNHNEIFKYYQKGVYPPVEKLFAIGDIHGDFNAFIFILKKAKLINNELSWCGGNAHVVQIGDILDRMPRKDYTTDEDSEFRIISLILKLQLESYMQGGGFHPIIGNHEMLNILGIFDYVSPMGMEHFKSPVERAKYFEIGGNFAKYLACAWNPVIKIGDFIFCHGGLSLKIAMKYKIENINSIMRDTLYGNKTHLNTKYFNELFLDDTSILWNRTYSSDLCEVQEPIAAKYLNKILEIYNAKYMVVGHTPCANGIKTRFNKKVICIDTGMSQAFGEKKNTNERVHFLEVCLLKNKIKLR